MSGRLNGACGRSELEDGGLFSPEEAGGTAGQVEGGPGRRAVCQEHLTFILLTAGFPAPFNM